MSAQQTENELLTYGYIRENYRKSVPIALINLCISFYDEYIYWIIKGDELQKFKNCKKEQTMHGPMVIINDIKFELYLMPKGLSTWTPESVVYGILVSLPDNIDYIQIYARLCCENTEAQIKCFETTSEKLMFFPWNKKSLRFNDILNVDTLCFNALIDIKSIIYKSNDNKTLKNYISMQKMRKYVKYTWYFQDKLVKQLTNGSVDQIFYSPNFDHNNWCLMIVPDDHHQKKGIKVGLRLLHIPNGVGSLMVEISFGDEVSLIKPIFDKEDHTNGVWITFEEGAMMKFNDISVSLLIVDVLDENGTKIRQNEWTKYGIIDYVYCPFIDNVISELDV